MNKRPRKHCLRADFASLKPEAWVTEHHRSRVDRKRQLAEAAALDKENKREVEENETVNRQLQVCCPVRLTNTNAP